MKYTHEQLINIGQITPKDMELIRKCRRQRNRLGFGYQLSFVKLTNRFPYQQPFEILDDILTFVSIQFNIPTNFIQAYTHRRETIAEHQERIRKYLGLRRFGEDNLPEVRQFIFEEACRLEQTTALLVRKGQFFNENNILKPSDDTLKRLITNQRNEAKQFIYNKIIGS